MDDALLHRLDTMVDALNRTDELLSKYLEMAKNKEDDGTVTQQDLIRAHVELSKNQLACLEFLNTIKPDMGIYADPLDLEVLRILDLLDDEDKKQLIELLKRLLYEKQQIANNAPKPN